MTEFDEVARLLDRVINSASTLTREAEKREDWARVVGERATEIGGAVSQTAAVAQLMATTMVEVLEKTQTLVNDAQILSRDFAGVLELLGSMNQENKSANKSLKTSSDLLGQVTSELKSNVIDRMRHDSEALTRALTELPATLDKSVSDAAAVFDRAASDALRQPVAVLMEQTKGVLRRIDDQNQAIKKLTSGLNDQNRAFKLLDSLVHQMASKMIEIEGRVGIVGQKVDQVAEAVARRRRPWGRSRKTV